MVAWHLGRIPRALLGVAGGLLLAGCAAAAAGPAGPGAPALPRAPSGSAAGPAGVPTTVPPGSLTSPPKGAAAGTTKAPGVVPSALDMVSAQDLWVGTDGGGLLHSKDGGGSWTPAGPPGISSDPVVQIDFVSPSVGWVLTTGALWATADGGASWTRRAEPEGGTLLAVDFPGASPAAGSFGVGVLVQPGACRGGPGSAQVLVTHDGGASWSAETLPGGAQMLDCAPGDLPGAPPGTPLGAEGPGSAVSACFVSKTQGWALVSRPAVGLLATTDGGRTWSAVPSLDPVPGNGQPGRLAVGSPPGRLVCSGGDAWLLLTNLAGMNQQSYSVFATMPPTAPLGWQPVLATSTAGSGPAPGFAGSPPKGLVAGPGLSPVTMAAAAGGGVALATTCLACEGGPVLVSVGLPGGKTWSDTLPWTGPPSQVRRTVPSVSGYSKVPVSLSFASATQGCLVGEAFGPTESGPPSYGSPVLACTSDGGESWVVRHSFAGPLP